jgi:hypothetical protein
MAKPETRFVVTLVAPPGSDGMHALKGFLKLALRRFGFRCTDVRELPPPEAPHGPSPAP